MIGGTSALGDGRVHGLRPAWVVAGGYALVFLALDWVSYIHPFQGFNITPWNPQPALAVALLLWRPRWLWWVWLCLMATDLVVRGMPDNGFVMAASAAALALSNAAIARALAAVLGQPRALANRRDVLAFVGVALAGALLNGLFYVTAHAAGGEGPAGPLTDAIARYWVGDAVGLVVMLPMVLALADAAGRRRLLYTLHVPQWWLIVALIGVLLVGTFGLDNHGYFRFFYVLLLPVVWASARFGLAGAMLAAGLTQLGVIAAVQRAGSQDLTVFELQLLMAVLTMTGLLLGAVVDEKARADADLKGSLQLAAAGQVAAALAHELSQPLTALSSYAQASLKIATSPEGPDAERLQRLAAVSRQIVDDAHRAGDVVKRLRDFFRSGTTQLQPLHMGGLLEEALSVHARRAELLGATLRVELADALPPVVADRVQIAVVLRNLLTNALDAVADVDASSRSVVVRVGTEGRFLRVNVLDSGPGVPARQLATLFDAAASGKPGGMGIGLGMCRAIVEAHGGRLWARPGPGGAFSFTLPADGAATGDADAP